MSGTSNISITSTEAVELILQLQNLTGICDSDCRGRCQLCPQVVVLRAADAIKELATLIDNNPNRV